MTEDISTTGGWSRYQHEYKTTEIANAHNALDLFAEIYGLCVPRRSAGSGLDYTITERIGMLQDAMGVELERQQRQRDLEASLE